MTARELHWRVGDQEITCRIEESKGSGTFHLAGNTVPFRLLDSSHIEISGTRHRFFVIHNRDSSTVWLDGRTDFFQRATKAADYASLLVDSRTEAAASLDVMTLGWASVDRIRRARSLTDAANRLMRANLLQSIPLGDSFAACLHAVSELKELERRYASHMRGARRQRFTAVIERLASPVSQLRAQYHF